MKMYEVEVTLVDGVILLCQKGPYTPDDDACVELSPEQIPMLCEWLSELASKAVTE